MGRTTAEGLMLPIEMAATVAAATTSWWDEINESTCWQDGIFFALCGAYALVSAVALIQLVRIEVRVPEYGWTTQKVFHLMNFIVNGVRAVVFGFHRQVFILHPKALSLVLLDLPGLLFFSAYTLLVLFWAEIYHQARNSPTDKLRIFYISINGVIYLVQVGIWAYLWVDDNSAVEFVGKIFIAVVSVIAALGFLVYGGRLFFMLRRFPIESKGRRKKLHEVGSVTAICFTCFLIRCLVVFLSAFDMDLSLDVLNHPVLNLIYYMLVEILPSALVLFILRKLPAKRVSAQYHPIRETNTEGSSPSVSTGVLENLASRMANILTQNPSSPTVIDGGAVGSSPTVIDGGSVPTAEQAYGFVRPEASRLKVMVTKNFMETPAAFLSTGNSKAFFSGNSKGGSGSHIKGKAEKDKLHCSYCGAWRHTKDTCFKLHGYPKWWHERHEQKKKKKKQTLSVDIRSKNGSKGQISIATQ